MVDDIYNYTERKLVKSNRISGRTASDTTDIYTSVIRRYQYPSNNGREKQGTRGRRKKTRLNLEFVA